MVMKSKGLGLASEQGNRSNPCRWGSSRVAMDVDADTDVDFDDDDEDLPLMMTKMMMVVMLVSA